MNGAAAEPLFDLIGGPIQPFQALLVPVLDRDMRRGLYGLALWYVATWAREVLILDPLFSRLALLLVTLGMAVGTGNIWRFPRIAASNGGGSFLFAWAVFLLLWSVPLILVEFAMGRETRRGPIGAFARLLGRGSAWMGAWVSLASTRWPGPIGGTRVR